MAVTSIWPIKGRVDKVINYARNPEKTTEAARPEQAALHAIDSVVEYSADEMKTEKREYVSCLNCKEEDAVSQFMETKRLWKKTDGRLCYHGYQSFKADEVDAATAHQIGVALAKELWGDRFEVVVATHCNTGHYHNHLSSTPFPLQTATSSITPMRITAVCVRFPTGYAGRQSYPLSRIPEGAASITLCGRRRKTASPPIPAW